MSNLLLIPTELEARILRPRLAGFAGRWNRCGDWSIELCGFGLIAAAARASMLIARERPQQVLLVGVAGAFDDAVAIGSAHTFDRLYVHGIGVGDGSNYIGAGQMGWNQWPGSNNSPAIGDRIDLSSGRQAAVADQRSAAATGVSGETAAGVPGAAGAALLSVCAASADRFQAQQRQKLYPEAIAEEMEGFGVAVACSLAGVPLRIVRGISNRAGDRELKNWRIDAALAAAAALVHDLDVR